MSVTQMLGERRFVFVMTNTGDEVLEGRNIEVRAHSLADALDRADGWSVTKRGFVMTLIGERRGYCSSRVFHPLVPLAELPGEILQNERFVGTVLNEAGHSVPAEQARVGLLAKRYALAEERGFGTWAEAG